MALVPPVAGWLEASLVRHLLGQYPLLVGGGALIAAARPPPVPADRTAIPLLLTAALALAFWLLPRWIDAAVADPLVNTARRASLVALAGLPLGWGWRLAGPVLRGLAWAKAATMLAVMGWLQLAVPIRLCNSYLIDEQNMLGRMFLLLAGTMVAAALGAAMIGGGRAMRPGGARWIHRTHPGKIRHLG
ncbi:MAG: hypothetical protein IT564_06780 [Rhodospirillales bacterium]|nr:hypothetical protein [Rhodospirillales bacterium]